MANLGNLINKIKKSYNIDVIGEYNKNHFIKGIKFLTNDDIKLESLPTNILYIGDYSLFHNVNVNGVILFSFTQRDLENNKYLYIKEKINLFDLYNCLYGVIEEYDSLEDKKKNLFNVLHSGSDLAEILNIAQKDIHHSIVLLDSSYSIIAKTKNYETDIVFEEKAGHFSLRKEFVDKMKNEAFNDKLYNSVYPFTAFLKEINQNAVFESIRINHSVIGYLFVRTDNKKATNEELEYIHVLSQIVSIHLQKNNNYRYPLSLKNDIFFKDLFLEHFKNVQDIYSSMKELFLTPKKTYFFIACGFNNITERLMSPSYYWLKINQIFENSITCIQGDYFLTLISTDDYDKYIGLVTNRFENFLLMNKMQASVSYRFSNVFDAKQYSNQAISHLNHQVIRKNNSPIHFYKHFFFDYLLYSSSNLKEIEASVHPTIREMIKYDKENKTEYVKTLITYLDNNRDAPKTAQALFIHKSTLFYRFDKMTKLFLLKLEDADSLFAYEFSLRVLKALKE